MPRQPRCFQIGTAYHVTQRGVDRQRVFFQSSDRACYLTLAGSLRELAGVRILAWCLMTNHVHWIVTPETEGALPRFFQHLQGRYAQALNARRGRVGPLWQNRYFACALDWAHLWTAIRYVELNPVRAAILEDPTTDRWSSAAAHCAGPERERPPLLDWELWKESGGAERWREMLLAGDDAMAVAQLRTATHAGKPFGRESFVAEQERKFGRHWNLAGRPRRKGQETATVPEPTGTVVQLASSV